MKFPGEILPAGDEWIPGKPLEGPAPFADPHFPSFFFANLLSAALLVFPNNRVFVYETDKDIFPDSSDLLSLRLSMVQPVECHGFFLFPNRKLSSDAIAMIFIYTR